MNVVFITRADLFSEFRHLPINAISLINVIRADHVARADIVIYTDENLGARTLKNKWGYITEDAEPLTDVLAYINHTVESRAKRS